MTTAAHELRREPVQIGGAPFKLPLRSCCDAEKEGPSGNHCFSCASVFTPWAPENVQTTECEPRHAPVANGVSQQLVPCHPAGRS